MGKIEASKLKLLSTLFSYPEALPEFENSEKVLLENNNTDVFQSLNLQALQNEYVRLFINALPEVSCPPYASFYLEGSLMGESTIEIREMYSKYSLSASETELPDHIAIELEFLGLLTVILESDLSIQPDYDFFVSHLRNWTPDFFECVVKNDRTGFYKRLSAVTRDLLAAND